MSLRDALPICTTLLRGDGYRVGRCGRPAHHRRQRRTGHRGRGRRRVGADRCRHPGGTRRAGGEPGAMSDPLYQAEILELAKAGRAIGRLQSPTATARVDNPLCGDRVTIDLAIEDGRVTAIGAKVQGCALCQAAAAIIAAQAPGAATTDLRAAGEAVAVYLAGAAGEDRKSTRLNSSH